MNHPVGLDRSQTMLFPESLDEYVAAENPVHFLDAFVGSLDLRQLGFGKAQRAERGRPPVLPGGVAPTLLLQLSVSDPVVAVAVAECLRNVKVIWLMGKLDPDFSKSSLISEG